MPRDLTHSTPKLLKKLGMKEKINIPDAKKVKHTRIFSFLIQQNQNTQTTFK